MDWMLENVFTEIILWLTVAMCKTDTSSRLTKFNRALSEVDRRHSRRHKKGTDFCRLKKYKGKRERGKWLWKTLVNLNLGSRSGQEAAPLQTPPSHRRGARCPCPARRPAEPGQPGTPTTPAQIVPLRTTSNKANRILGCITVKLSL